MRRRHAATVLFFGIAVAASIGHAAAEPLQIAPIEGVVLLRNGQVLAGKVARAGDYYYVSMPRSEIRLKAGDVEKVAKRPEELYEFKRTKLRLGELRDHLDLAEWCVEQKLLEQAAEQLALARSLDPRHPRIALVERRLELARQPVAERPVPRPAPLEAGPTNEELDRLVRGMPSRAIEGFTSSIQPLLVNNCTTSGCHGPRSQGRFKLFRLSLGQPVNRRSTQRNLYAVWQVIDADRPAESPLLTLPVKAHGKLRGPIFSGREAAQYRQLVAWVYEVSRQRKPPEPDEGEEADAAETSTAARSPQKKKGKEAAKPAGRKPASDIALTSAVEELEVAAENDAPPESKSDESDDESAEAEYVPVDSFDPEIFNRLKK